MLATACESHVKMQLYFDNGQQLNHVIVLHCSSTTHAISTHIS